MTDIIYNWMLETGLAVTLLIGFVLLIRRPFARQFGARLTYALWALPVIRLFMPVIVLPAKPVAEIPAPVDPIYVLPAQISGDLITAAPGGPVIDWPFWIVSVWIGGAALWLGWQLMLQSRFRQTVTRDSTGLSQSAINRARRSARKMGVKHLPEMRQAADNIGPLVTGLIRPVIIVPKDFDTHYTAAQQDFALSHELMHIRRKDLWAAFTGLLFRALNWPNPLVHWAAEKFRADQEAACDATVLYAMGGQAETTHDYAETLLHAARRTVRLTQPRPLGLTIYHPLKERLMILNETQNKASNLTRVLAMALIASAITISAPFTRAEGPSADGDVEVKMEMKKVLEMVENVDGVETRKKYEITTVDGETKAYEIDELGNKIEVDPDTIDGLKMHGDHMMMFKSGDFPGENIDIKVMKLGDGEFPEGIEKRMVIKMDGDMEGMSKEELQAFIEKHKSGDDANVFVFKSDEDMKIAGSGNAFAWSTHGNHNSGLVSAAKRMTEKVEKSEDLTRDQRRKLEKAIKALEAAQKALEEE